MEFELKERMLRDLNEYRYYDHIVKFKFGDNIYEGPVNFAYLNEGISKILTEKGIQHDESWLWDKPINVSYYNKMMNKMVDYFYNIKMPKLEVDNILHDIVTFIYKVINILDSGSRTSLDISLIGIMMDMKHNKDIYELLTKEHVNEDMLPEDIDSKKSEILGRLKELPIYGIQKLLLSQAGVKADQVFNCIIGLWLRTRTQKTDEVAPRFLAERWMDGINTIDSHFIESNNNRRAAILSKQTIKESGVENKHAGILSQDTYINMEDCGSVHGVTVTIRDQNDLNNIHHTYMIMSDGSNVLVDKKDTRLIGQTVKIRNVMTCACKEGVCAKCFGHHEFWNRHTELYKKDLGSEFTKNEISPASQEVLSFKHSVTPDLIPLSFELTNLHTGEITYDISPLLERKFNKLIPKEGVKLFIDVHDVTNRIITLERHGYDIGTVIPADDEYGERDIVRLSTLYLNKDEEDYVLTMSTTVTPTNNAIKRVDFTVNGFDNLNIYNMIEEKGNSMVELDPEVNIVRHIMANRSKTARFTQLKELYNSESVITRNKNGTTTDMRNKCIEENGMFIMEYKGKRRIFFDSLDGIILRARDILPKTHLSVLGVLYRNKIKDRNNIKLRPDWTKPEAKDNYVILSEMKAINALPSLVVKLGLGYFEMRINTPFYYDKENLTRSTYDLLIDTREVCDADKVYESIDDFLATDSGDLVD